MKVAIINSVYGTGSTGKIVKELEECLKQNNVEVKVFYGRKTGNESGGEFFGSNLSVKLHALFSRLFGKQGLYSKSATKQLISKLEEFKPDIVNLHNLHGYYINFKMLFNYLTEKNIKVYWTLHDLWPITGHCAYFEDCNIVNECKNCGNKSTYPKAYFDNTHKNYLLKKDLFTKLQDLTFICPSSWIKQELSKSFLQDKQAVVINNGIDLQKFSKTQSDFRQKHNLQDKKLILGVSLQWSDRKGLTTFNKLAHDLPQEYKIVLVGINQEEVSNSILSLPKTNTLQELIDIYSACDIFVNPTIMDNFPTVNIEALSCGLPVITYATGGSGEIIDKSCGVEIDKGDYNNLLNAILNFDYNKDYTKDCLQRSKLYDKADKYGEYLKLFLGEKC